MSTNSCSASASTRPASSASPTSSASAPPPAPSAASPSSHDDEPFSRDADPLYDPRADAADEAWLRRHLGATDVRLSCPSCFALLCVDAQAHAEYDGQWRAVFVRNCAASEDGSARITVSGADVVEGDKFQPVACTRCLTEVAVLDEDEVYHFFNVCS